MFICLLLVFFLHFTSLRHHSPTIQSCSFIGSLSFLILLLSFSYFVILLSLTVKITRQHSQSKKVLRLSLIQTKVPESMRDCLLIGWKITFPPKKCHYSDKVLLREKLNRYIIHQQAFLLFSLFAKQFYMVKLCLSILQCSNISGNNSLTQASTNTFELQSIWSKTLVKIIQTQYTRLY